MANQRERWVQGLLSSGKVSGDAKVLCSFASPTQVLEVSVIVEGDQNFVNNDLERVLGRGNVGSSQEIPIDGCHVYLLTVNLQQLHEIGQREYVGSVLIQYGNSPR